MFTRSCSDVFGPLVTRIKILVMNMENLPSHFLKLRCMETEDVGKKDQISKCDFHPFLMLTEIIVFALFPFFKKLSLLFNTLNVK